MAAEGRVQRVASELQKVISLLLRTKIKDSKLATATITEVELSKDLSYAKVYYTCLDIQEAQYITKAFEKSKGFFRSSIAKSLNLRIVPNLKFVYDKSLDYGMEMEGKIQQALEADSKIIKQDDNSLQENYKDSDKETKVEKLR
ncbi:30S ribosome-binding factor RbfA [Francisella philomiragia]|uniref:30S ribosome-binding factor RbfA n=1 Tax=Francisella philomiragia TaxID=28110 RepID=UPI001906DE25|nr:30S ribosome-binding factor RbfA [Francisella philomiragia]MBK2105833.1 30S ribosome-binding factor RbfA [Francisella philomiragia]MBK2267235.1 30S ribosome-binding factor RbfA [Francisella philomiragia]MBK2278752.1 30S ribosome-binding factor RbfA [Francisella philomiragia]MBK2286606.1 30S ribosome-binding factor RbfA [Francisella philomiragia]MBK2288520.1 30S ribosome-binding factor RbfA [Francisella philomiragia]